MPVFERCPKLAFSRLAVLSDPSLRKGTARIAMKDEYASGMNESSTDELNGVKGRNAELIDRKVMSERGVNARIRQSRL